MNDLVVRDLVEALEMGDVQGAHGLDRHRERLVRARAPREASSRGAQNPQDLCPVEPLPFAMLAKTHGFESIPSLTP